MTCARRRRPAEPCDVSATNGTRIVGRVIFLGQGWRAEGRAGHSLGVFETRGDARDAIAEDQRATR